MCVHSQRHIRLMLIIQPARTNLQDSTVLVYEYLEGIRSRFQRELGNNFDTAWGFLFGCFATGVNHSLWRPVTESQSRVYCFYTDHPQFVWGLLTLQLSTLSLSLSLSCKLRNYSWDTHTHTLWLKHEYLCLEPFFIICSLWWFKQLNRIQKTSLRLHISSVLCVFNFVFINTYTHTCIYYKNKRL